MPFPAQMEVTAPFSTEWRSAPNCGAYGVGRALLAAGEVAVAERGASAPVLNVFGSNAAAVHLYTPAAIG